MAKKFKILLMVFALGLFVFPKQMLFAQTTEMSCCSESSSDNCCGSQPSDKNEMPCHDSGSSDQKCNGCNTCASCHIVVLLFSKPSEFSYEKTVLINTVSGKFNYITPEISDISGKIWQPPKIG